MINSKREYRVSTVSVSVTDTQSDTDRHGEIGSGLGETALSAPNDISHVTPQYLTIPCISPIAKKLLSFEFYPLFSRLQKLPLSFEFYSLFSRARSTLPFWKNPSEGSVDAWKDCHFIQYRICE